MVIVSRCVAGKKRDFLRDFCQSSPSSHLVAVVAASMAVSVLAKADSTTPTRPPIAALSLLAITSGRSGRNCCAISQTCPCAAGLRNLLYYLRVWPVQMYGILSWTWNKKNYACFVLFEPVGCHPMRIRHQCYLIPREISHGINTVPVLTINQSVGADWFIVTDGFIVATGVGPPKLNFEGVKKSCAKIICCVERLFNRAAIVAWGAPSTNKNI